MQKNKVVNVRIDKPLAEKLATMRAETGLTNGQLLRALIENGNVSKPIVAICGKNESAGLALTGQPNAFA